MVDATKGSNVYIIIDNGVTLIDTGMGKNTSNVLTELKRLGFERKDIKNIIITHAHFDHYQCLAQLKEGTNARVMVGEADADFVEGKVQMPTPKGAIGVIFRLMKPIMKSKPVPVDVRLKDGDTVDVLGGLKVVSLSGHTPGNIGLYQSQMKLVLSSDTVGHRKGRLGLPSLYKENPSECKAAIKRLYELDVDAMLPGHGPPIMPNASEQVKAFYQGLK
jgi:glyoxylase-like metal-dependent hydrolase (beta-lactamase superfamily II)